MIKDHTHTPEAIARRLNEGPKVVYLKEWIYGGIDGVVTTFAIVAAVIGAGLSPFIVLILGLANLIGDGFSMAAGAYSGAKAESDQYKRMRQLEVSHIRKYPEGEREETRQIFAAKGFSGDDLEHMVDMISRDQDVWIEFMLAEEYGLSKPHHSPFKAGIHTFMAFFLCGAMPLVPFLIALEGRGPISLTLAALTFFLIGSLKSLWSIKKWWREGLETLAIGLVAAGLAYGIGYGLQSLVE